MRFNYALATLFSFSVLFFTNLDSIYSQELAGEDERIIITVDSVVRYDSFPENLKQEPRPGYTTTYKSPKQGNDFTVIYFTLVKRLKDFKYSKSVLIDDSDNTCQEWLHTLTYVSDGTGTIKENGYLLYEMPKVAIPVHFKYFYEYGEEVTESQEKKIGQQNIDLLHNQ